MENIFLTIFNMSVTASYIALAVILLRRLLKNAPKFLRIIMWAVVGIRLICPFSFESIFSLIPSSETLPQNIIFSQSPTINSGIPTLNNIVNPIISESFAAAPGDSVNPLQIWIIVAAIVWIIGIAVMLLYAVISYLDIRTKVNEAALLKENIYICDGIGTPFILGVIKPKIYLPSDMPQADTEYVLAHEKAHIKRLDYLWKPLGFLLLSIYWFNPILWLAYILLCKDIELACDERVIKQMGSDIKKPYSEALLNCSVPRRLVAACPLAFGETGVKSRIKSVLNYKKPTFWIIAVALICCIVLSVCFLTNPKSTTITYIEGSDFSHQIDDTVSVWKTTDGNSFNNTVIVSKDLLKELFDIKISKNPVSNNRSDYFDRDHTNTIVLREPSDLTPSISSALEGFYICFNKEFTEVFVCGRSFKTTLSYRVKNPQKASEVFKKFITLDNDLNNGGTYIPSAYKEYFDLPTDKGLEIYVWRNNKGTYESVLKSGRNLGYTAEEIFACKPVNLAIMREIISSYDIDYNKVTIVPVVHPSYNLEMTETHKQDVKFLIFGLMSYDPIAFDNWGLRMFVNILDEDYFQVVFDHSLDYQTEVGKLTTTPEFELFAIHNHEVITFGDYMRNVLNQKDYKDEVFTWDAVLYTIPSGEYFTLTDSFKGNYGKLPTGQYILTKKVRFEDQNGDFFIRTYAAEFTIEK